MSGRLCDDGERTVLNIEIYPKIDLVIYKPKLRDTLHAYLKQSNISIDRL
jgi:hypothetical protein